MLEIKNIVTKMKDAFGVLISKLDMAEETVSELEGMLIETSKIE